MPGPPPREGATEARGTDAHHRGATAPGSSPAPSAAGTPHEGGYHGSGRVVDARSCREPTASACPADAALKSAVELHPPPPLSQASGRVPKETEQRRRGARGTKATPSANALRERPATSKASRVLPTPPGPVRVNRRASCCARRARRSSPGISPHQGCSRRGKVAVGELRRRAAHGGAARGRLEPCEILPGQP